MVAQVTIATIERVGQLGRTRMDTPDSTTNEGLSDPHGLWATQAGVVTAAGAA